MTWRVRSRRGDKRCHASLLHSTDSGATPSFQCVQPAHRPLACVLRAVAFFVVLPFLVSSATAQRLLLFEDFQNATPDHPDEDGCFANGELHTQVADECIGADSVDRLNRSRTVMGDPSFATVTGGMYDDPFPSSHPNFGEGNQSLLLRNPNNKTQQAVNWFSIFPEDPNDPNFFLRDGYIEFDAYLKDVLPDSKYGFLDVRLGFESDPADRNQVTSTGDQVIWQVIRLQEGGVNEDQRNFVEDRIHDVILTDDAVLNHERSLHVRFDLNGDGTYDLSIDNLDDSDPPVVYQTNEPWAKVFNFQTFQEEPAPGINEISFLTDASAQSNPGVLSSPDVYIDNLRVFDNLVPSSDFDKSGAVDGRDLVVWQRGQSPNPLSAADLNAWQASFGQGAGGASAAVAPEPATSLLCLLAALLQGACRRTARRRSD